MKTMKRSIPWILAALVVLAALLWFLIPRSLAGQMDFAPEDLGFCYFQMSKVGAHTDQERLPEEQLDPLKELLSQVSLSYRGPFSGVVTQKGEVTYRLSLITADWAHNQEAFLQSNGFFYIGGTKFRIRDPQVHAQLMELFDTAAESAVVHKIR